MKKQTIRALLLAAGLGTRLRPLTDSIPKCLVPIGGQPLLGRWLDELERIGCEKVVINKHYLADHVDNYLSTINYKGMEVKSIYEQTLLGTAGSLLANKEFFNGADICLLIHADNATDIELDMLIKSHLNRCEKCVMTMLTFSAEKPEKCGIVELDKESVVIKFHEKIKEPPGNCANGAIYVFGNEFIDLVADMPDNPTDFSTEVLPKLLGRIQACHTDSAYLDIGTLENLRKARALWRKQSS